MRTPPRRAPASSLEYVHVRGWSHRGWQAQAAGTAWGIAALRKRRSAIRGASKALGFKESAQRPRPDPVGSWSEVARIGSDFGRGTAADRRIGGGGRAAVEN